QATASFSPWSAPRTCFSRCRGRNDRSRRRLATPTRATKRGSAGGLSRAFTRRRVRLEKHHRVLGRDVELLAAGPARHRIVDTNHIVAELGEERAIALIRSWRNPILARAHDPAHLILVRAAAPRSCERVAARLVAVVEEIAFVERHVRIILSF